MKKATSEYRESRYVLEEQAKILLEEIIKHLPLYLNKPATIIIELISEEESLEVIEEIT